MAEGVIGQVAVSVVPDARDFWRDFKAKIDSDRPEPTVRVNADTREARAEIDSLGKSSESASGHVGLLKKALVSLAPAAVPVGGVLAGAFAGLLPVAATAALGVEGISKAMKNGSLAGTKFGKDIGSLKKELGTLEGTAGAGLLGGLDKTLPSLKPLFGSLNKLVGSLSQQLGRIVGTLGPALVKVFTALQPLFTTFGNLIEHVAKSIGSMASGSGISSFVKYVQRELPVVERAFSAVYKVVGSVIKALAPVGDVILRVFAQVAPILARVAGSLIKALAPALTAVVRAVGPLIKAVAPLLGELGVFVRPLVSLFKSLFGAVMPVVRALASALRPILPIIANAFDQVAAAVKPMYKALGGALVSAIQTLAPLLPGLFRAAGQIVVAFTKMLASVTPLITPLIKLTAVAIEPLIKAFTFFAPLTVKTFQIVSRSLKLIIDVALQATDAIIEGIDSVVQHLPFVGHALHQALQGAADAVERFKASYDAQFNQMNSNVITPKVNIGPALSALSAVQIAVANINNPGTHSVPIAAGPATGGAGVGPRASGDRPPPPGATHLGSGPGPSVPFPPLNVSDPGGGAGGGSGSSKPKPPSLRDVQRDFAAFVKSLNGTASQALAAFRQLLSDERKRGLSSGVADTLKAENVKLDKDIQRRNDIANRLGNANMKMLAAEKALATEARTIKAAITGSFDITSAGTGFDGNQPVTLGNIIAQQKQDLQKAKQFAAGLRKLAAEGLNKPELRALAEAGPSALAQVLALEKATPKQIAGINADERATGNIGAGLGKSIGEDLYGSRVSTDRALVKTLEKRDDRLVKEIAKIADRIDKLAGDVGKRPVVLVADGRQLARVVQTGTARNKHERTH